MDLLKYHSIILRNFRQHEAKFGYKAKSYHRFDPAIPQVAPRDIYDSLKLRNTQDLFEYHFLFAIRRRCLDDEDIQFLAGTEIDKLQQQLSTLFQLLNKIVNDDLISAIPSSTSSSTLNPPNRPYPRLEALLLSLSQFEVLDVLDLTGTSPTPIFKIDTIKHGELAISHIKGYNQILDSIQQQITPKTTIPVDATPLKTVNIDDLYHLAACEYRELVESLLDTLHENFEECEEREKKHNIMIRLADVGKIHQLSGLNLNAYLQCGQSNSWQNTRFEQNEETQSWNMKGDLCNEVKSSLSCEEGLILHFSKTTKALNSSPNTFKLPIINPEKNFRERLRHLITERHSFSLDISTPRDNLFFPCIERQFLAAKLALNLLLFCGSKNTLRAWDGSDIYFVQSTLEGYDRNSPYFACTVSQDISRVFPDSRFAPIPCFTEFARLLLEIRYGKQPIEHSRSNAMELWKSVNSLHSQVKEDHYDDIREFNYLGAVESCLRFHRHVQQARNSKIAMNEDLLGTYRRLIWTGILQKLLVDLPGFRELRRLPSPTRREAYPIPTPTQIPERLETQSSNSTKVKMVSLQETPEPVLGGFLSGSQSSDLVTAARGWLSIFKCEVVTAIERMRRKCDQLIKVAVLDTGIDQNHEVIQNHLKANGSIIAGSCDFIQSPNGINDCVGHGTAVCDILLQVAKVALYVGKISDSATLNNPDHVAQGIRHSESEWGVNIIILCLGFRQENASIDDAIKQATYRNKIIIAAASNSGSLYPRTPILYPARLHGHVISIRSATGHGKLSMTSPPRLDNEDSFMILGEGIEAAWPESLNDGKQTRLVFGCSYATAVAAGIAALTLEFSIQEHPQGYNISEENRRTLWRYEGIRRIFEEMTLVKGQSLKVDCKMICPWSLFTNNESLETCRNKIKNIMKEIRGE